MPIYEYECRACGQQFERFIRPAASPHAEQLSCPSCQSVDLERLISLFAVDTGETQQLHIQRARKAGAKGARDKQQADIELAKHIAEEHNH